MSGRHAILISTNPLKKLRHVDIDTYKDIQAEVGGTFDVFTLHLLERDGDGPITMSAFCNDVGRIEGMDMNPLLTALYGDVIAGPVLLMGPVDSEGETMGLDTASQKLIVELHEMVRTKYVELFHSR